ncbi:MAG: UrcA family protein [Pseudomonadota bacterium]
MKQALIATMALSGLALMPAASAEGTPGFNSTPDLGRNFIKTVDISGFDLNSVDGVARAHRRIVSTAYQVCSPILSQVSSDQALYRSCILESVDNAIGFADQVNLTSFHLALPDKTRGHIWKRVPANWQPVNG